MTLDRPSPSRSLSPALVTLFVGTRPEAIKLAPVVRALQARSGTRLVLSGQHEQLAERALHDLGLEPNESLHLGAFERDLNSLTARLVQAIADDLRDHRPDAVVVQGDTTTAFCGALAAFHEQIPVAHVEAGLRSNDLRSPFPEEANRRLISQIATWHFAPTDAAAANLCAEGHGGKHIFVTGNTVIDALEWIRASGRGRSAFSGASPRRLLVTLHRRESHGHPIEGLCEAVSIASIEYGYEVVLPAHPNPAVRRALLAHLPAAPHVQVVEPLGYADFIATLADATLVLSDSGGVQEEAPSFNVPVLIARAVTERNEAISVGGARLVGTDPQAVTDAIRSHIAGRSGPRSDHFNPFGDGRAGQRIAEQILRDLDTEQDVASESTLNSQERACAST